ncbi:2Fe-2S iron-sulfur cluster-binding protein [Actibacterium sp.]|uniref:PDR/VanB family oxidoreductase n=1 Tax=Actibacterium sp. TaxID=1872125 RepID=UPI003563AD73
MPHTNDPTETYMAQVAAIETPAPGIRLIHLSASEDAPLPGFDPGAHISVRIPPNGGDRPFEMWRSYSLIAFPEDVDQNASHPRRRYLIGVLREAEGKGGSRYMHDDLSLGQSLTLRLPPNGFSLEPPRNGIQFVAGGIGVTPLISMASWMSAAGADCDLHYTCRTHAQHILKEELNALPGANLHLYADEDPKAKFSVDAFLDGLQVNTPIYVCGPAGLIDAVIQGALARKWSEDQLHSELFAEAGPVEGDEAFEVEIASSGEVLTVPADRTLLDVLEESGAFVMYDCRQGHCGLCSVPVLSGEIVHHDIFLSDDQKAQGDIIQACVSRGKGRLVLDL